MIPVIEIQELDISEFVSKKEIPYWSFPLKEGDSYLVRSQPYDGRNPDSSMRPGEQAWLTVKRGDAVVVPLVPYCTGNSELSSLLSAFALVLMRSLPDCSYRKITISIGRPLYAKDDHYQFWLGVVVQTS